ncbi:MAG: extracellular solute-binding protein [Rhodocyclaceae bacterium]|nr:extracellular solute-binding protein [Rhodocyclaceae bacterium]
MRYLICLLALGFAWGSALAQEVMLRHALEGRALASLGELTLKFNDEQKGKAKVVLQGVGGLEQLTPLPHMAFLDSDESVAFFGTRPRFLPIAQVMSQGKEKFSDKQIFPQAADAVDDLAGKIEALPMGLSLPVLFYSKDAFRKVGLDPENPPKTWWELQKVAGMLFDAGYKCPLTASGFSWVHLENNASQAGEPVLFKEGKLERLSYNSMVNVKHIALLASWQKSRYFHWFGGGREGNTRFTSGQCAMLTGESAFYAEASRNARFAVGVAELPYYDDVYGAKQSNVLPDGEALRVLAGKKKEEYQVVARFLAFLLRPENQKNWVRATGYLPMTPQAIEALKSDSAVPGLLEKAHERLSRPRFGGARVAEGKGRSRIRAILHEEIEFVWRNQKPAKEALDTAVVRANHVLQQEAADSRRK